MEKPREFGDEKGVEVGDGRDEHNNNTSVNKKLACPWAGEHSHLLSSI